MKAKLIGTAVIAMLVAVGCGKKEASRDGQQATPPNHVEEILALAKKSAEKDNNINFCGFFTGMSRYDAQDLARHYKLEENEYSFTARPDRAVSVLWFSPKGVRRMTDGGSTIDELAQAVAKRVGGLKERNGNWERRTIDGFVVTFSSEGLTIRNDSLASQTPLATAESARKDRADKEQIPFLIRDMVAIPGKSFKMGKYEVTQAQWQAVMGENPSHFKGSNLPVEDVSWDDCKKFLEKLNDMPDVKASGLTFRLPTEKEWKYACRAGSTGDYCKLADGTEITESTLGEVAWYYDNSDGKTHPVGQKKPNAFGLYDMHGNVEEWCEDDLYWAGDSDRVSRGGSWFNVSWDCRASSRGYGSPDARRDTLGFRLAASQDVNR